MERLASFIKNSLNLTKSEFLELAKSKEILVNGIEASFQYVLKDNDIVTIDGKIIERKKKIYYAYNKDIGIICTNDKNIDNGITKSLDLNNRVFCVGRLDKESHGLMILTNDGDFAHKVLTSLEIDKEYIVKLKREISDIDLELLKLPIEIKGKMTNEAKVKRIDNKTIDIILNDGKYHQIRRLVKRSHNEVEDLYRIRIGNLHISIMQAKIEEIKIEDVIKNA